jgi:hypothetical protein
VAIDDPDAVLCPSFGCEAGAMLIGIILPNGRVAFAADKIVIDQEFVAAAREGRSAESRFRFAGPCVRTGCRQWTGERCGVIDRLLPLNQSESNELPECAIRPQCRWFRQSGPAACAICPEVITDARELSPDECGRVEQIPDTR